MQKFSDWTLETIRNDGSRMSWMEERRYDWTPLIATSLNSLLNGVTFIIITDKEREWFGKYIIEMLNRPSKNRPLLPFYSFKSIFSTGMEQIKTREGLAILQNLLAISFDKGYRYFYIGSSINPKAALAKSKDDSLMWIMDETLPNSFYLNSNDDLLDIKLIQLARLLDKSIDSALLGDVLLNIEK